MAGWLVGTTTQSRRQLGPKKRFSLVTRRALPQSWCGLVGGPLVSACFAIIRRAKPAESCSVFCVHTSVSTTSTGAAAAGVREAVHFLARFAVFIASTAEPRPKACIRAPSTGALTSAPNTGAHTSHSSRPERPTDRLLLGCFIANASFPHKFASFSSVPPPPPPILLAFVPLDSDRCPSSSSTVDGKQPKQATTTATTTTTKSC